MDLTSGAGLGRVHDRVATRSAAEASRAGWSSNRRQWQAAYARWLRMSDIGVVIVAVALAQRIRFGHSDLYASFTASVALDGTLLSATVVVIWLLTLALLRTRDPNVTGGGFEEYRPVTYATMQSFGGIAILSLLIELDSVRAYLAVGVPIDGRRCRSDAGPGPRRCRPERCDLLQILGGSPDHTRRPDHPSHERRRTAAVVQRSQARDEHGRPASADAGRGRRRARLRRTPDARASRHHRVVAGVGTLRSVRVRPDPAGPVLCVELVDGAGPSDRREDRTRLYLRATAHTDRAPNTICSGSHRAGRDRTRQKLRRGRSAGTGSPVVSQISVES